LISALEVIRAIDGPIVLANCFTADSYCGHVDRCTVRRPLKRIHEAILRLLESVSIEDMLLDSDEALKESASHPLIAVQSLAGSLETPPLGRAGFTGDCSARK
jgi:DNA-binding IscR family transcriptional regulator